MHDLWESDLPNSPASSDSSFDEDEVNRRTTPYWPAYRGLLKARGFKLDTVRDVKEFYQHCGGFDPSHSPQLKSSLGYIRACQSSDEDALCPDAGLPDNLFRGTRLCDGKKIVVKAVHLRSREYEVIWVCTQTRLRADPMNHTIPILDLIEVKLDAIALIVMEEWSSQLIPDSGPCCLRLFLASLRQCIEHVVFLHKHHIAHLDISLRNLLTDYDGHYAYIDYELSRRFDPRSEPCLYGYRGTEIPPECERGDRSDPFKVDVWALAVLILRACKLTGYHVPELLQFIRPMLHDSPAQRPTIFSVLPAFDRMVSMIGEHRMQLSY